MSEANLFQPIHLQFTVSSLVSSLYLPGYPARKTGGFSFSLCPISRPQLTSFRLSVFLSLFFDDFIHV